MPILYKYEPDPEQKSNQGNGKTIPAFALGLEETNQIPNYQDLIGLEGRILVINPTGTRHDGQTSIDARKLIGVISREPSGYHVHGSEFQQANTGNQFIFGESYIPLIAKISYDLEIRGYGPRLIITQRPDIEEALNLLTNRHIDLVRAMQPRPKRLF